MRSMTLMPVSNISSDVDCSSNAGSLAVDRHVHLRVDGAELVDGFAEHVEHAAKRLAADRHHDARAGVDRLHAAHHALGGDHGDAAHAAFAEMLLHLHRRRRAAWAHRSLRW